MLPRLVVAAPASGHGKTTVATGLMAALAARGLVVSGHKVGPDYIDPGYHALATGRPGRNLDPVLCGENLMVPLLRHGAAGADMAVIEGAMGLFDGRGCTAEGSTAHVARLTGAPVLLVVDTAGQGSSVAALVAGFAGYDPRVRVGGVVLNRVSSARHEEILRAALAGIGMPVLGALRRDDTVAVPSRHLGLIPAPERAGAAAETVRRLGALVARSVGLDGVVALARTAGSLAAPAWAPPQPAHSDPSPQAGPLPLAGQARPGRPRRPVVAVAGGAAFTFGYAETPELLAAAGAEVATFDPLRDEALPPGTSALVIGGGFPEEYAGGLSANERLRVQVAALARSGAPVIAECAGLLYLARELDGQPMCGVLPVTARMTGRLTLGYRDAVAASGSVLAPAGLAVRGHEFHRTVVLPDSTAMTGGTAAPGPAGVPDGPARAPAQTFPAWTVQGRPEGFIRRRVHASYLHLHWAGQPAMAARVVRAAA
jgi:cobyrinic acid a,c-diamide synthase